MSSFLGGAITLALLIFRTDLNGLEFYGLALAGVLAVSVPGFGALQFRRAEKWLGAIARKRALSVIVVGVLAIGLRLALLPITPPPQPVVTDEFSHTLLGKTLALGRATNPTHPMWTHLETIHVIQKPTYASMYLPGQGAFLALGMILTGHPWAGVVLAAGLMCMAICWALQGWLPPSWALYGGLIAVARFSLFSYWMDSYWGGALGAMGGALVIGAWPRIRHRMRPGPALLLAAGLGLLVMTRPFEGAVVSIPVAFVMLRWLVRLERTEWPGATRRVVLPIVLVLCATGGLLGYYNARVTGSPFRLGYTVNQQTYGWPLTLAWFPVQPRVHATRALHEYFLSEVKMHEKLTDFPNHILLNLADGVMLWTFFTGPALTLFLLFLPWSLRDKRMRLPAAVLGAGLAAVAVEQSRYPHYFAPATAAFLIVLLQAARHMRATGARRNPTRLALVRYVPLITLALVTARAAVPDLRTRDTAMGHYLSWCCNQTGNLERARIVDRLDHTAGNHLVLVRYGPRHLAMYEWLYNEPDIDRAKVVWARETGHDEELFDYFSGRRVWLLVIDDDSKPPDFMPYSASPQRASAHNQAAR